jgi:copper(I)-binding protein
MIAANLEDAMLRRIFALTALLVCSAGFAAQGNLIFEHAWIRSPPPGAGMLAGYAVLRNSGNAALTIVSVDSPDFGKISLHETVEENGVEHMRPLGRVEIPAGTTVVFAPGGKHFMLMQPKRSLIAGDGASVVIHCSDGSTTTVRFAVQDAAPASTH